MLELASKSTFSWEGYFAQPGYRGGKGPWSFLEVSDFIDSPKGSLTLSEEQMERWDRRKQEERRE